jgi:hypothetical protein
MKFRYFTDATRKGIKIAVNIDQVQRIETADAEAGTTYIFVGRDGGETVVIEVGEDFDTVFSRLNTIFE